MSESVSDSEDTLSLKRPSMEPSSLPTRISWNFISDQIMSVLNIERGIFYSVVELLFRPGKAVRKHLFKNRNLLVNPVRFLVLSTTLATFVAFYFIDDSSMTSQFGEGFMSVDAGDSDKDARALKAIMPIFLDLFKQFVNISYFFLVPAGAIVSWFFVRKRYNAPELSVAHCFMWSMVNCFTIIFTPLVAVYPAFMIALGGLSIIYPLYFYTQFFNQGVKGFIKGLIINFINYILLLFFFIFLGYFYFKDLEGLIFPHSCDF